MADRTYKGVGYETCLNCGFKWRSSDPWEIQILLLFKVLLIIPIWLTNRRISNMSKTAFEQWKQTNLESNQTPNTKNLVINPNRPWYKESLDRNYTTSISSSSENEGAKMNTLSFDELAEMIATGKPIPGIKQIPNRISSETPSSSITSPPKKPWER